MLAGHCSICPAGDGPRQFDQLTQRSVNDSESVPGTVYYTFNVSNFAGAPWLFDLPRWGPSWTIQSAYPMLREWQWICAGASVNTHFNGIGHAEIPDEKKEDELCS